MRGEIAGLLPLAVERARERGDERLEVILTTRDVEGLAAFEQAGWTRERDVYRMWLELAGELPEPSFPAGVRVRPYTDGDARRLHAFLELAYADNNERIEPFDQWLHFMTQHGEFAPDFWHLAEDENGELAAVLTWAPYERLGWVKDLAVHPGHRRRGLGEAMLITARAPTAPRAPSGSGSRSTPTTRPRGSALRARRLSRPTEPTRSLATRP